MKSGSRIRMAPMLVLESRVRSIDYQFYAFWSVIVVVSSSTIPHFFMRTTMQSATFLDVLPLLREQMLVVPSWCESDWDKCFESWDDDFWLWSEVLQNMVGLQRASVGVYKWQLEWWFQYALYDSASWNYLFGPDTEDSADDGDQ